MTMRESAMLILRESAGASGHWLLDRSDTLIGREEDCDIILADRKVSRHHARITRDAQGYLLSDLASKNGTFVNGEPAGANTRLHDGDEIGVALCFRLLFVDAGATVPLFFGEQAHPKPRLRLDREARMVYVNDNALQPPLSPAQFRLLELLQDHGERVVEREEIVSAVWAEAVEEGVSEQAIDALVRRLRERLSELDPDWQYIVTVRGHGFRLSLP